MDSLYSHCTLCPRSCGTDRTNGKTGFCRSGDVPCVNLYKLHFGEEPVISGTKGSGTIFFEGCNLGCVFCQNYRISSKPTGFGTLMDPEKLTSIMFELKEMGAHNINLVTPMHYAPTVADAVKNAKNAGLDLPVILNISGYDSVNTLKLFDGLCDIFLTDFKFHSPALAGKVCSAPDYPEVAVAAIDEMVRQQGEVVIGDDGLMKKGVIVRHLMLPGQLFDTKNVIDLLLDRYGDKVVISLMNQYTPTEPALDACRNKKLPASFAGSVNAKHYETMCDYLSLSGHPMCFMQETDASGELWIPDFKF